MTLSLVSLDERVRELMISELRRDVDAGNLYISNRLSGQGQADYQQLLETAFAQTDPLWLATELRRNGRLSSTEPRRTKSGFTEVRVPATAADTLAEGEFNRFYMRAVCLRAIEKEQASVKVYRAKAVSNPRPESEAKIGTTVPAEAMLSDLRTNPGTETAFGLPSGPNSGLSVHLLN